MRQRVHWRVDYFDLVSSAMRGAYVVTVQHPSGALSLNHRGAHGKRGARYGFEFYS
jgi:hypothetical protein